LTTSSADRALNRGAYDQFWAAFPRKVAPTEAERAFSEVVQRGVSPDLLVAKARAYAATVDPSDLRFVPSPHSWLRQGRYDDQDLFTNQLEQQREWFRQCWRDCNVKAVEDRYHITFDKVYPPEEMTDVDAIKLWYRETARAWISEMAGEKLRGVDI
jgi:hypothetical protein